MAHRALVAEEEQVLDDGLVDVADDLDEVGHEFGALAGVQHSDHQVAVDVVLGQHLLGVEFEEEHGRALQRRVPFLVHHGDLQSFRVISALKLNLTSSFKWTCNDPCK